jgi:amidase
MNVTRRQFVAQSALFAASLESVFAKGRSQLIHYDALGVAELIRKKEITALEAVEDVLRRMERVNPRINAVLTANFDFEKARARAKGLSSDGLFAGTPVMLKNLVAYTGARIDSGSRLDARRIAAAGILVKQTSPLVDAMEQSGMIVTGITNAPEFGLIDCTEPLLHGPTRNPWNLARTPGGSSGGSAAAIAAGIVPLAHGNDGGGSIRIPASQCGVFGLKPTRGRELGNSPGARGGLSSDLNISSNLCLSRTVRDTAAFLSVVENRNPSALTPVGFIKEPSKKRLKIGLILETLNGKRPHPDVELATRDTAKLCTGLGHTVEETKLGIDGSAFMDAFLGFWATGTLGYQAQVKEWFGSNAKSEDYLEPWTLGLMELARSRGPQKCRERAEQVFPALARSLEILFAQFDVLLSPVMTTPPYPIGYHAPTVPFATLLERVTDDVGYTPIHNAAGTTAMSVPLHWSHDGLPIGSQFAAWRGGEATLLGLAYELEAAKAWAKRHPKVFAS